MSDAIVPRLMLNWHYISVLFTGHVELVTMPGGAAIGDGKATWKYDAQRHIYSRQPGPPELDLDRDD